MSALDMVRSERDGPGSEVDLCFKNTPMDWDHRLPGYSS